MTGLFSSFVGRAFPEGRRKPQGLVPVRAMPRPGPSGRVPGFRGLASEHFSVNGQSGLNVYGKTMVIGILEITLYLPESHSLKEKRQTVKSIKDKVHNRFNVAIAEIGDLDLWQKASLGICTLGNDRRHVNGRLDQVANFVEGLQVAVDMDFQIELMDY